MKNNDTIYSDFISSIKTTHEAANLSSEIDLLISSLFKSGSEHLDKEINSISIVTSQKIMEIFSKNNFDSHDNEFVKAFLDRLKQLITQLKIIKLTLAFEPSNQTVENIHNFIIKEIGSGYILDIEVSEKILGGAIVIFNGKYNDFTVEKSLNEAFRIEI